MPKKPTQEARRLKVAMQTESDYESCAARLKALADPDRLQIVNCLLRGEKNRAASEPAPPFPNGPGSTLTELMRREPRPEPAPEQPPGDESVP